MNIQISKNQEVQELLNKISFIDSSQFEILNKLRKIVFENYPKVEERIMYGGIMFSLENDDFSGLFVRKSHISFEFTKGFCIKDPQNLLEGKGKYRRHLKIKTDNDIENKNVEFFVKQVI